MIAKLRRNQSGGASGRSPSSRPMSKLLIGSPSNFTHTGHCPQGAQIEADLKKISPMQAPPPQPNFEETKSDPPSPAPRRPTPASRKPSATPRRTLRESISGSSGLQSPQQSRRVSLVAQTPELRKKLRDSICGPMSMNPPSRRESETTTTPSRLRSSTSSGMAELTSPIPETNSVLLQGYLLVARTIGDSREWEQHWCQLKQGWSNILAFTNPGCEQLTASISLTGFIHSRMTNCGDDRAEQHVIIQTARGTRVVLCNCPIKAASWVKNITRVGLQLQETPTPMPPTLPAPPPPAQNTENTEEVLYTNVDQSDVEEDDDGFEEMCRAQGLLSSMPPSLPLSSPPTL